MKITRTSESAWKLTRSLIYGESGSGKTTSILTLPHEKTLVLGVERGLLPLVGADIAAVQISAWHEAVEAINTLASGKVEGIKDLKFVVLDSLTEISELCKQHIIEVERPSVVFARTRGALQKNPAMYDALMDQEAWGVYRTRMRAFVSALVHLPYHVIVTSLSQWTEDKIAGALLRTPALGGKLAMEIPAFFDLVLHMESRKNDAGELVRVWRTVNDGKTIAKDASGILDPFEDTDWTAMLKKILVRK